MSKKSVILMYGNCQVRELAQLFRALLAGSGQFEILWIRNWGNPELPLEHVRRCSLLLWQQGAAHEQLSFEQELPDQLARITFPALTCEPFWPFGLIGGDFLLDRLRRQGLVGHDLVAAYNATDITSIVNLDRMWEVYSAKITALEERTTIKIYDSIIPTLSSVQHFWMPIHPSHEVLLELGRRIAAKLNLEIPPATGNAFLRSPLLGGVQVPLHPQVISHFDISWAGPATKYIYDDGTNPVEHLSHEEYLRKKAFSAEV